RAQQADKPASEEKEKARRAAEEAAHSDPCSAGGRSGRRAMAAATADDQRAPRAGEMTAVAPAVIPLVHAPDDPGPNGETEAEPPPQPATPPVDGRSRIRALVPPERGHSYNENRVSGELRLLPPPLWGRVGEGGDAVMHQRCLTRRPPPPTPPHKGEGSAPSARARCASNAKRTRSHTLLVLRFHRSFPRIARPQGRSR